MCTCIELGRLCMKETDSPNSTLLHLGRLTSNDIAGTTIYAYDILPGFSDLRDEVPINA